LRDSGRRNEQRKDGQKAIHRNVSTVGVVRSMPRLAVAVTRDCPRCSEPSTYGGGRLVAHCGNTHGRPLKT
jgi:hypothetical protein